MYRVLCLVVFLTGGARLGSSAGIDSAISMPSQTPRLSGFGVCSVTDATWPRVTELGVQWWRTPPVVWGSIEPVRGELTFDRLDAGMRRSHEAHLVPIVPLICNSTWGTRAPSKHSTAQPNIVAPEGAVWASGVPYPHIRSSFPLDINAWQTFLKRVVERYDCDGEEDMPGLTMGVKAWQLGTEIPSGWDDTAFRLVDFLQISSAAIREADPEANILLPGLSAHAIATLAYVDGYPDVSPAAPRGVSVPRAGIQKTQEYQDTRRLLEVLLENGNEFYDIFDVHLCGEYPRVAPQIRWLKEWMQRLDCSKPLVCLEAGGAFAETPEGPDDAASAEQMVKVVCAILEAGVQAVAVPLSPHPKDLAPALRRVTLLDETDNPKPSYYTYQLLIRVLEGYEQVQRETKYKRCEGFAFAKGKKTIHVYWCEATRHARLPIRGRDMRLYRIITQRGVTEPEITNISSGSQSGIALTSVPVILEEMP